MRKATISFFMPFRLSVCPCGTTLLQVDGFPRNFIFEYLFENLSGINFMFSPCIFKVNHFYFPTNAVHSFIHLVFCLTTGPKRPPKRCLHIVRSRASSFKWEYPLLSLRSSSSFLRLLPRLLATSIPPFFFPLITCFRRQFLRKMWPIQLAFRFSYFL